jgi:hypothetical protein
MSKRNKHTNRCDVIGSPAEGHCPVVLGQPHLAQPKVRQHHVPVKVNQYVLRLEKGGGGDMLAHRVHFLESAKPLTFKSR